MSERYTDRARRVLVLAQEEARMLNHDYLGTEHLLLGLIREGEGVAAQILVRMGADMNRTRQQVIQLAHGHRYPEPAAADAVTRSSPSAPQVLDWFGRNLTAAARAGELDPVIGRDQEINRVMQVLSRRTKNNPVLVGEPGVGKTAVVAGLARKIALGEVSGSFTGSQVYALDLGAVVAGSRGQADYQNRLTTILAETRSRGGIIVFVDDLHALLASADGAADMSAVLKQMLARGEPRTISATTPDGYRKYLVADAVFERSFQPIQVTAPTISHTIEILRGLRNRYEAHHLVTITDGALEAAARLAGRSLPGRPLLSKAMDLIDESSSMLHMRSQTAPPDPGEPDTPAEVNEDTVAEASSIMSGAPSGATADWQQPAQRRPPFPPAAMTAADKAIWAMS
jgi:ATP-dependent Clp protease ATP-binding subunit ClpC